jgi:Alpha/beta hydrolase family
MNDSVFVLIHSPLVGPLTWRRVASELQRRGKTTLVPVLTSALGAGPPYWRRHSDEVLRDLRTTEDNSRLILVAHSGAGSLLPVIGESLERRVAAYVFVDAGIPEHGKSRFELFGDEDAIAQLRRAARNGLLPPWNQWFPETAMVDLLPDAGVRARFLEELRPTPLVVYEEQIPVFAGWPDAPCFYLQLSAAYDREAARARSLRWPVKTTRAGHLHMLVDPAAVTDDLLDLVGE